MAFISVTRLRVRSLRYLLPFVWQTFKVARQAQYSPQFLGGRILREARNTFWTVTAWEDEIAMRRYRQSGAHGQVMPKLLKWCDEAAYVHWIQDTPELPNWHDAHSRLLQEGRLSKVYHPSPAQVAGRIAEPKPGRGERTLKPAVPDVRVRADSAASQRRA
jgi:hypothetical protein